MPVPIKPIPMQISFFAKTPIVNNKKNQRKLMDIIPTLDLLVLI